VNLEPGRAEGILSPLQNVGEVGWFSYLVSLLFTKKKTIRAKYALIARLVTSSSSRSISVIVTGGAVRDFRGIEKFLQKPTL